METTVTLDATLIGTVISPAPDQWIIALEMVSGPSPPGQIESYLPYPFDRWTGGRFVLNDSAAWPKAVFSFNPTFAGTSGSEFFHGPALRYRGDLILEACPVGPAWSLTTSDVEPPPRGYA
jgi:hypothetical protein